MKLYIFLFVAIAVLGACTTHRGFVDFKDAGVYASENAGNKKFDDVGPISAAADGFVWDSCDKVATEAVKNLLDVAKARGANTVYNIKFDSRNGIVTAPTCTKAYGWFLLYVVGGLGPWVTSSEAQGVAAKISSDDKKVSDAIAIPQESDTAQLAADFISRNIFFE